MDPANGTVELTGTSFGDKATFACNLGFELIGTNLTCGDNGQWSAQPPDCKSTVSTNNMVDNHGGLTNWENT